MSVARILFYSIIYLSTNPTIIELLSLSVCLACTLCGNNDCRKKVLLFRVWLNLDTASRI